MTPGGASAGCRRSSGCSIETAASGSRSVGRTARLDAEGALKKDKANKFRVARVTTDAVRMEVDLREGFSAGVLEWAID